MTLNQLGSQVGSLGLVWFVKQLTDSSTSVGGMLSLRQALLAAGSLLVRTVHPCRRAERSGRLN